MDFAINTNGKKKNLNHHFSFLFTIYTFISETYKIVAPVNLVPEKLSAAWFELRDFFAHFEAQFYRAWFSLRQALDVVPQYEADMGNEGNFVDRLPQGALPLLLAPGMAANAQCNGFLNILLFTPTST